VCSTHFLLGSQISLKIICSQDSLSPTHAFLSKIISIECIYSKDSLIHTSFFPGTTNSLSSTCHIPGHFHFSGMYFQWDLLRSTCFLWGTPVSLVLLHFVTWNTSLFTDISPVPSTKSNSDIQPYNLYLYIIFTYCLQQFMSSTTQQFQIKIFHATVITLPLS